MNDQAKDKLLETIRKLMAKANGTENEAEAQAFANKAQALLAEHNLSMSDVKKEHRKEDDVIVEDNSMLTDSLPWRRSLATAVAQMYFCRYFYSFVKRASHRKNGYIRYDAHAFVGAKHNVEVAKIMFSYLNDTVDRLADEATKKYPNPDKSSYRTSFRSACATRVHHRILQRIAEAKKGGVVKTASGTNLPALMSLYEQTSKQIEQFMAQKHPHMKQSRRTTLSNLAGINDGRAAGDRVGLDTQLGGTKAASHLIGAR